MPSPILCLLSNRKSCRTALFTWIAWAAMTSRASAVFPSPHQPFQSACRPSEPHQRHWEFWNQAKRVLRKYNRIDRKSFPLFLKECEFDLTSAHRPGNFKPSGIGVEFRANLRQPLLFSVSIRLEASSQYFGDRDSHPEEANFCSCLKRMYFRSSESFSDDLFESWVFNLVYVCLLTNRNTKPQFIWS